MALASATSGRSKTYDSTGTAGSSRPAGPKPSAKRSQSTDTPVARCTIATAAALGTSAVRNIELVTAVETKAVHIR